MNAVHFTYLARLPGERGNSVKFSEEGEGPDPLPRLCRFTFRPERATFPRLPTARYPSSEARGVATPGTMADRE